MIGNKFHTVLFWLDSNSKRPISNSESHRNDDASPSPPMMMKRARPSEEDLVNESQSVPETEITRFEIEIKASRTFPLDFVDQKIIFSLKTSVLLNFLTFPIQTSKPFNIDWSTKHGHGNDLCILKEVNRYVFLD